MAAFAAELYKHYANLTNFTNKYELKELLFQKRAAYPEIEIVPPEVNELSIIGQFSVSIHNLFDHFTD